MKRITALVLIGMFTVSAVLAGCGENAPNKKAESYDNTELSTVPTEESDLSANYSLDSEVKFGDIKFNVDKNWSKTDTDDTIFFHINDSITLFANKISYDTAMISEEDVFEIHISPDDSHSTDDILKEKVSGNNVVLFSHKPISENELEKYLRHIVTIINGYTYDLYAQGNADDSNYCDSIIKDVYKTLKLPEKETESVTTEPTTETLTETPTETPTEAPKIINNTSSGGFWAEGSGDYIAEGLKVNQYAVLHIKYNGSGNFAVKSYEGDDYDDLLVNNIGDYSGDVLITHSGTFDLVINAKGDWSIIHRGLL